MAKKKTADLLSAHDRQIEVNRLRGELYSAVAEKERAETVSAPYARAFWEAHDTLAALPLQPMKSKERRLRAYDRRLRAGHAWHPHKRHLLEVVRWIKAIEEELKTYE